MKIEVKYIDHSGYLITLADKSPGVRYFLSDDIKAQLKTLYI